MVLSGIEYGRRYYICIHPSRFSRVDAYKQRSIYAVGWRAYSSSWSSPPKQRRDNENSEIT